MTRLGGKRSRLTFRHRVEYASIRLATPILGSLPSASQRAVARLLSWVWFFLLPFRRRVVLENLARAFPERSARWRRRTARRCCEHFVRMTAFEFPAMLRSAPDDLRRRLPRIEGAEHYRAVKELGTPWIFVSGHIGNWELAMARFAAVEGDKTAVLAKPLHNALIEREIARVRAARGYEVLYTRDSMRLVLNAVRDGKSLAFLADQDARRGGIPVPFFAAEASTAQGPAFFAYRLRMPILVGICVRQKDKDAYRIRFHPPIVPNPQADREAEIERMTREHVAILEAAVRETPEQYFWFHRRWKTHPRS